MAWRRIGVIIVSLAMLVAACSGGDDTTNRFGPVVSSFDDVVGTEIKANGVVALPCIPSRSDPVGVWVGVHIDSADQADNRLTLGLEETDARFGSHPSGCRAPQLLLAQSVFLFQGNSDPIFASAEANVGGVTVLEFDLGEQDSSDYSVVVVPTLEFEMANGELQTTIFGIVGRYSLD